ncbi:hypothetical protein [Oligosphaera ethanolica]|uniref:Uncharacterized protein n=1 Tax=Oligosphaera ethanolica TaxID=760260 RepID=A0AAE4AP62_9BACT|nr:hypothetical protein [Oligosphaera ethanolica]MDQ0289032.1 hypothetical protein [Oligosphaera ethanolica]
MDWTVGTFGTLGNDALDSWERRRPGGIIPGSAAVPAASFLGPPPSRRHHSWDRRRPGGIHPGTAAVPALFGPERPDYVV